MNANSNFMDLVFVKFATLISLALFSPIILAEVATGERIYLTQCQQCHGPSALGNQNLSAPRLAGQQLNYLKEQLLLFQSGQRGAHPDDKKGNIMSAISNSLNASQIDRVSLYLASLTSPVTTRKNANQHPGQKLYQSTCAACHGHDAKGSAALFTPNLAILSDWYLTSQFESYLKGWRGNSDVGSTRGKAMRAAISQVTLKEEREFLIDYITTKHSVHSPN